MVSEGLNNLWDSVVNISNQDLSHSEKHGYSYYVTDFANVSDPDIWVAYSLDIARISSWKI